MSRERDTVSFHLVCDSHLTLHRLSVMGYGYHAGTEAVRRHILILRAPRGIAKANMASLAALCVPLVVARRQNPIVSRESRFSLRPRCSD
jgi:hypothetical protein